MEVLLYMLAAVLSLIGLATVIRGIVYSIYSAGWETKMFHCIYLDNNSAEIALRDAIEQLNWNRFESAKSVIAVDNGLDEGMRRICEGICSDIGIPLVEGQQLDKTIKEKLENGAAKAGTAGNS